MMMKEKEEEKMKRVRVPGAGSGRYGSGGDVPQAGGVCREIGLGEVPNVDPRQKTTRHKILCKPQKRLC